MYASNQRNLRISPKAKGHIYIYVAGSSICRYVDTDLGKVLNGTFSTLPSSMGHGTRECGKSSMEFHGTLDLDKIPWNSMEFHGTTDVVQMLFKKFHGTHGTF